MNKEVMEMYGKPRIIRGSKGYGGWGILEKCQIGGMVTHKGNKKYNMWLKNDGSRELVRTN